MGKPNLILFGRSSLFLLLCFSVFLPGAASAVTCLELMAGLVANEGLTTISDQLADINGHRERTVLVVGEKAGVHGGEILTVRRIGSQWGASATTTHNEYDPQGDPRWFIDVMGAKTAAFFGFRILDGETMEVPNFREFHGATNKLNQILVAKGIEPISVRFFESKDSENTKVSEYLKRFCEVFEIPLASDGNHFFHDMSFHSSAMFLPEEFAREAAHYYRFQRHFF